MNELIQFIENFYGESVKGISYLIRYLLTVHYSVM